MKKLVLAIGFVMTVSAVFSQQKVKKGLGFGALPAISYDSDLGFQYGALVNLFDYGDGTNFPKYNHSLYLELSTYTKGTTICQGKVSSVAVGVGRRKHRSKIPGVSSRHEKY